MAENLGGLWDEEIAVKPPTYVQRNRRMRNADGVVGFATFIVCESCGSFVSDTETHTEWHKKNDKPF